MSVFIGVDVGGTKTHTLAVDSTGEILGFALDGAGGTHRVGIERFKQVIARSIGAVLAHANRPIQNVGGIGLGVAGLDWPSDLPPIVAALEALELCGDIAIHNDGDLPLAAGCKEGWGLAVIAGTGSVVTGIGPDGEYARSTGGTTLLGELGGGKELVDLAIQAVSHAYTLRGPQTRISDALVRYAQQPDVVSLLAAIARQGLKVSPDFSRTIVELAREGDQVAVDLLARSGEDLGLTALGVIRQLSIQDRSFEVVLSGSMFKAGELLTARLKSVILNEAPGAVFTGIETAPVLGGVILAMKKAGFDFRPVRTKMLRALNDLLACNPVSAPGDRPILLSERGSTQ